MRQASEGLVVARAAACDPHSGVAIKSARSLRSVSCPSVPTKRYRWASCAAGAGVQLRAADAVRLDLRASASLRHQHPQHPSRRAARPRPRAARSRVASCARHGVTRVETPPGGWQRVLLLASTLSDGGNLLIAAEKPVHAQRATLRRQRIGRSRSRLSGLHGRSSAQPPHARGKTPICRRAAQEWTAADERALALGDRRGAGARRELELACRTNTVGAFPARCAPQTWQVCQSATCRLKKASHRRLRCISMPAGAQRSHSSNAEETPLIERASSPYRPLRSGAGGSSRSYLPQSSWSWLLLPQSCRRLSDTCCRTRLHVQAGGARLAREHRRVAPVLGGVHVTAPHGAAGGLARAAQRAKHVDVDATQGRRAA